MFRLLAAAVLALPLSASAYVVFESVEGEVTAGVHKKVQVRQGERIVHRAMPIATGPGAKAMLRFDDGLQILLHENSELRIWDYIHTPSDMRYNYVVLDLTRGSGRFVMGSIARNNPRTGFQLMTPQAYLQAKGGADFAAAIVNPLYLSVNAGSVLATNNYGAFSFSAGSSAAVATNAAMPVAVPASSLPAQASAAFGNLNTVAMASPGGAASGAAFGTAGGTGFTVPAVAAGAAALGLGVAAARSNSKSPVSHSATNH
jgi:hypothetical protein